MTATNYNENETIYLEGEEEAWEDYFDEQYEPAVWYEEDYGFVAYEPSPYDGTYSEC